jgi:molybdopterin synthase catalytic subunit
MSEQAIHISSSVTQTSLDANQALADVSRDRSGATVQFLGVVRDHDGGRMVDRLEYLGHPTASERLASITAEVLTRHPSTIAVSVHHRVGPLALGDLALVAAASTAHRAEAFAVVADLVESVKAELPIWKHQYFQDGTDEWVNSP